MSVGAHSPGLVTPKGEVDRSSGAGFSERLYASLIRIYPAAFRARYRDEMVQLFADQLHDARVGQSGRGLARAWLRALADLVTSAAAEHLRGDRSVAHSTAMAPPGAVARALGAAGVLGGLVLLAGFVVNIGPDFNWIRIVLFNVGAIAIGIALARRAAAPPALLMLTAGAVVLANAWYIGMTVLSLGVLRPNAGTFGYVYFLAGAATWLADAAFGAVLARKRRLTAGLGGRAAAVALAIGSLLAFTGMDRLGLVSRDHETIFATLSLFGVFLNGLGWITLGLDVAIGRRRLPPSSATAG
jgi:hypothetical protein